MENQKLAEKGFKWNNKANMFWNWNGFGAKLGDNGWIAARIYPEGHFQYKIESEPFETPLAAALDALDFFKHEFVNLPETKNTPHSLL